MESGEASVGRFDGRRFELIDLGLRNRLKWTNPMVILGIGLVSVNVAWFVYLAFHWHPPTGGEASQRFWANIVCSAAQLVVGIVWLSMPLVARIEVNNRTWVTFSQRSLGWEFLIKGRISTKNQSWVHFGNAIVKPSGVEIAFGNGLLRTVPWLIPAEQFSNAEEMRAFSEYVSLGHKKQGIGYLGEGSAT